MISIETYNYIEWLCFNRAIWGIQHLEVIEDYQSVN